MKGTFRGVNPSPSGLFTLCLLIAFAGCSGGGPEQLAQERAAHPRGGTFHMALEQVGSMDPGRTDDAYEAVVVNQLFSGLIQSDVNLNVMPDVAECWTISQDGLEYAFELRRDARFHNGNHVTSDDFIYTFTRLFNEAEIPPGIIQGYLNIIDGVDDYVAGRADHIPGLSAPDPFTLVIRLSKPYPSFLNVLCMDQARVVPRQEVERVGTEEFGRHPVGSGPFQMVSWEQDTQLVLAANRDYFGTVAYLDTLVFHHFPHDLGETERREFDAGRLQTRQVREDELAELLSRGDFPVVRRLELSLELLGFNTELAPFNDVRVRRAVSMALDRSLLAEVAGPGYIPPVGLLPPGMPGFTPESKIIPEDEQVARALLAEVGYGPQNPLRFPLYTSSRTVHAAGRDSVIVECLHRIGVLPELRGGSWLEFLGAVNRREAPAFLLTWIGDLPDPDSFVFTLLASGGDYNLFDYSNTTVDSLLAAGQSELNLVKRLALYREAEQLILDEAPLVPLFNVMTLYALQPFVHGMQMSPFGIGSVPMEKIWLEPADSEGMYAGLR